MDPLLIGRRLLQANDYDGAVRVFSETMSLKSSHLLIPALEGRAKSYLRQGELKKALMDSREIVRNAPGSVKGYLITGDICMLMERNEAALAIYERGLEKVKVGTDDNRSKLQSAMAALQMQLEANDKTDRLSIMPMELLCMILEYLDVSDLVQCLSLSRGFKKLLEDLKKVWMTLDLSTARGSIPKWSLMRFLTRSEFQLKKAIIKLWSQNPQQTIRVVAEKCKYLECLSIDATYRGQSIGASVFKYLPICASLKTLIISSNCEVSLRMVSSMLGARQSLQIAEFHYVTREANHLVAWPARLPCLQRLVLTMFHKRCHGHKWQSTWQDLNFDHLINSTPNLIEGRFEGWGKGRDPLRSIMPDFKLWTKLEVLSLKGTHIDRMPMLPQSLVSLDMSNHDSNVNFSFADLESVQRVTRSFGVKDLRNPESCTLPNLEELYINKSESIRCNMLAFLTQDSANAHKLKVLDIGGRWAAPPQYLEYKSVVKLSLANSDDWGDDTILAMVLNKCMGINELDLSKTLVTGYALKKLLTGGVPLKKIILKDCSKVSWDTYDYLTWRGIKVVH